MELRHYIDVFSSLHTAKVKGCKARLMRDNPDITYAQLTRDLRINTSAVQKLVKRMTNNVYYPT